MHNEDQQTTRHHRKPVKLGGTNDPKNIMMLPRKLHENWHSLFNHMTPQEIALKINNLFLDPDYEMVAIKKHVT